MMEYEKVIQAIEEAEAENQELALKQRWLVHEFAEAEIKRQKAILELKGQLIDPISLNIFRRFPSLQSFTWKQFAFHQSIAIAQIKVGETKFNLWADGNQRSLGTDLMVTALSEEARQIAEFVNRKIRVVDPNGLVDRFGENVFVEADRKGFTIK